MKGSAPQNGTLARSRDARLIVMAGVIGVCFLFLIISLLYLQVVKGLEFKRRAKQVARREIPIPAQRGRIFDRNYEIPLVYNIDSFAVDVIPGEIPKSDIAPVFGRLSGVLGVTRQYLDRSVPERYYHLYQPIEISDGVPFRTIAYIAEHIDDFSGISWRNKPIRSYADIGSIAHVVGFVGDITQEELQVLYNRGYSPGTLIGKSGIEKQYDEILRGRDGRRFSIVDVTEKRLDERVEDELPPEPGPDLVLTIDRRIQRICEQALGPRIGSVVVLKPSTGEVLSLVSYPWFDPAIFYIEDSADRFKQLALDPSFPFLNRTIQSVYPPGSVFKIVMTTAILEEAVFPATKTFDCTGALEFGDRVFGCWQKEGHGEVDLFNGFAQSCDVYFYNAGNELGVENIGYYAREYGLGALTGIDLPGEVAGSVPTPEWKEKTHNRQWVGGDTLNLSIGQGYLTVSPIQMANMVAMVANEGVVYEPHIVKEIRDPVSGSLISEVIPKVLYTSQVGRDTFRRVQEGMRKVIVDGTANVVITTQAVEVAGKTGTAEVGLEDHFHYWFAAYAPYRTEDPDERIVVVTMVEAVNDPEWWAPKAANIILQAIFADQTFDEAVETLKPWYVQEIRSFF